MYEKSIDWTLQLLEDGYTTADLRNLKSGLNLLDVKNDSQLSIKRLLMGLEKFKSLKTLADQIEEKEKSL